MMENKRKIKEIYKCNYIISDEKLYPLQRWYNELIDKTINEVTVADVLRMMRQKEFLELAMKRAIEFLQENVFVGETYDGELLEKISDMNPSFLKVYSDNLETVLKNALNMINIHEWSYEGEKEEFKKLIDCIKKKIM